MPGMYAHERCCDLASAEIDRFAAVIRGADPATPVPTCGRWTLADLVQHIGQIHRWAAAMVAELSRARHSRRKADLPLPADPASWPGWLAEGQALLMQVLRAADPEARMWAWGPDSTCGSGHGGWCTRPASIGSTPSLALGIEPRVDPAVAADGVEEFWEEPVQVEGAAGRRRAAAAGRGPDWPDQWTITRWRRAFRPRAHGVDGGGRPGAGLGHHGRRHGSPRTCSAGGAPASRRRLRG